MDTRQLAAFCEVVDRKSFSRAAERLGVTQPAISLQVRSLEKRLGQRLLDRSGRRVEPTEAGRRLYRGAQRLLALEGQLLEEVTSAERGSLTGMLEIGASTGPGGTVVPLLLAEFQRANPGVSVSLSISDTQSVVDRVAERELELGVVGAARRHRQGEVEPFFRGDGACERAGAGPRDLARPCDRPSADPRGAGLRRLRQRSRSRVIVRWGLRELPGLLGDLGIERSFLVASDRWSHLDLPVE